MRINDTMQVKASAPSKCSIAFVIIMSSSGTSGASILLIIIISSSISIWKIPASPMFSPISTTKSDRGK